MKHLILLDQSIMKSSHCLRKLYWQLIKGYRAPQIDVELAFGIAFHIFAKDLEESSGNFGYALRNTIKYFRETKYSPSKYNRKYLNEASLIHVCTEYFERPYKSDPFDTLLDYNSKDKLIGDKPLINYWPKGEPIVEKRFFIDLYDNDNVSIKLVGTIDKIMVHRTSRLLAIDDYKTTSAWQKNEYLDAYTTNCQLMVYTWALKYLIDNSTTDSVLHQFKDKTIASFINGVFVKSSTSASCEVEFQRSKMMQFDSPKQLAETHNAMLSLCEKIDRMLVSESLPSREGIFNGTCYNCMFADNACPCEWDVLIQNHVLEKNFITKSYNPMEHGE